MEYITSFKITNYKNILKQFDLIIKGNSFVTILGENGSGKSTLALFLSNLDMDKNIFYLPSYNNYIFLSDCVSDELKLYSNFDINNVDSILKGLKCLNIKNKKLLDLNNSEKQLLIIACAFFQNPDIIVFDDSLSSIDPFIKDLVLKYIYKYCKKNEIIIINITNDTEESIYSDYIGILSKGKMVSYNKKQEIYKDEKVFEQNNLKIPFIVELCVKLKYYGLVDKITINKSKLVNYIWK